MNMASSKMDIQCKPLSISEKLNVINKVDGVPNVPHTKITEGLGSPLRKVTDKMLRWLVKARMC
jgi:hypothetical protein